MKSFTKFMIVLLASLLLVGCAQVEAPAVCDSYIGSLDYEVCLQDPMAYQKAAGVELANAQVTGEGVIYVDAYVEEVSVSEPLPASFTTEQIFCAEVVEGNLSLTVQAANGGMWPGLFTDSGLMFQVAGYNNSHLSDDFEIITLQDAILDDVRLPETVDEICFGVNPEVLKNR